MLNIVDSRILHVSEYPIASGVSDIREGQALVAVYDTNGKVTARPSTGVANEEFLGFAISTFTSVTRRPRRETVQTGTSGSVELSRTPILGSFNVETSGTNAATTVASGSKTLTVHSSDNNKDLTVVYEYAPSVTEVLTAQGDLEPGTHVTQVQKSTGCVDQGLVFTDYWDTNDDWTITSNVSLGASGYLTTATTGTSIAGAAPEGGLSGIVTRFPIGESLFLGLRLQ